MGEHEPDLVVVEAMLVTLQPLVVSHLVVVQDKVDCPEGVVQDTAQEDAVVVVHPSDVVDSCGSSSSGFSFSGFAPGVGLFPGPMVIVGHGTLGTGGGTGGGYIPGLFIPHKTKPPLLTPGGQKKQLGPPRMNG